MNRILITPCSLSKGGHPALAMLEAAGYSLAMPAPGAMPDEAVLIAALPGCVGWLAGVEPVSERVLDAADRLRVISRKPVLHLTVSSARTCYPWSRTSSIRSSVAAHSSGCIFSSLCHFAQ
jgi:hypothetical protein